ncbi:MAG: flavodoxin family protein [Candidatus Brocadiia bacterium]
MKILGISTSGRFNGNTSRLVKRCLDKAAELGAQTEFIWAGNKKLGYCSACEHCMKTGECIVKDDYQEIMNKVLDADGLIMGTPNYAFDMSGLMKTIYDRSHCLLYYQRKLAGKYAIGISVGGHIYRTGQIAKTVAQGIWLCGGYYSGYLAGVSVKRDELRLVDEDKTFAQADRLAVKLFNDISRKKTFLWQRWLRGRFLFPAVTRMVFNNKDKYPYLYNYYLEKKYIK